MLHEVVNTRWIGCAKGEPISFTGRRRPTDAQYVLKHAVMTSGSAAQVTDNKKEQLEQSSGSTGALFWQTIDGYRYVAIDDHLLVRWTKRKPSLTSCRTKR